MPFVVKDWRNDPDATTPLSAVALEDVETRLSAYADSVAAGGVELGYAQITSNVSTTATAVTDIASLTVTVTVGTRPILIRCHFDAGNTTSALGADVILNEDGTDIGKIATWLGDNWFPIAGHRRRAPSAGSHTYKLRSRQSAAGTYSLTCGNGTGTNNGPGFIQVIEI